MAAIPVTFVGFISYSDLSVGGGPMPGGPPLGIWGPGSGYPTHPIAPGGQPPGIWGGAPSYPSHPIAPGGQPPYPSQGPGFPSNPIYIPIQPPPDSGLSPEHPIYIPVYPEHPIANVPTWEEIKGFIFGNLPPGPDQPQPVR
jgi:hypothetical protein